MLIKQNAEKNHFCSFNRFIRFNLYGEDSVQYAVLFYIWLFNFCTWILLDLPEKYKALVYFICIFVLLFIL